MGSFTLLEKIFIVCAVAGSLMFIVRLVTQFLMGDADLDHDGNPATHNGAEADLSFKLLTLQGLTAFFMMFGLTGLALTRQSQVPETWALAGGALAGLASVWVIDKIFKMVGGLQSSGNLDMSLAVGQEGRVYLTIPAGGSGQVEVTIAKRLRVVDAVSTATDAIATGERVRVVKITENNIIVVERIS